MRYLGGTRGGGQLEDRQVIELGSVRMYPIGGPAASVARVESTDAGGRPWRVTVPFTGAIMGQRTLAWAADFDLNGREDLVIGVFGNGNGRCTDVADTVFLLFDEEGRPVPWRVQTRISGEWEQWRPGTYLDADRNGRPELVIGGCEYSWSGDYWEERWLAGVYEARDARWRLKRDGSPAIYESALRDDNRHYSSSVLWRESTPEEWTEPMEDLGGPSNLEIEAVLAADDRCRNATRISFDLPQFDCIAYSDGIARRGWPGVVIDSVEGRNIYAVDTLDPLLRLIGERRNVRLVGPNPDEPDWVWAEADSQADEAEVASELVLSNIERQPISTGKLWSR